MTFIWGNRCIEREKGNLKNCSKVKCFKECALALTSISLLLYICIYRHTDLAQIYISYLFHWYLPSLWIFLCYNIGHPYLFTWNPLLAIAVWLHKVCVKCWQRLGKRIKFKSLQVNNEWFILFIIKWSGISAYFARLWLAKTAFTWVYLRVSTPQTALSGVFGFLFSATLDILQQAW